MGSGDRRLFGCVHFAIWGNLEIIARETGRAGEADGLGLVLRIYI